MDIGLCINTFSSQNIVKLPESLFRNVCHIDKLLLTQNHLPGFNRFKPDIFTIEHHAVNQTIWVTFGSFYDIIVRSQFVVYLMKSSFLHCNKSPNWSKSEELKSEQTISNLQQLQSNIFDKRFNVKISRILLMVL